MSFSFEVKAGSITEACEHVRRKMAEVVSSQPVHGADATAVEAAVETYLNEIAIPLPLTGDVRVVVAGSISRTDDQVTASSVSIAFNLPPAAA